MSITPSPVPPREELDRDLGLGSRLSDQRGRILNQDGSFNVRRKGMSIMEQLNLFHWLITLSFARFLTLVVGSYLLVNVAFALGYYACGPQGFAGAIGDTASARFWECFFFSVQTVATIGYGKISPNSLATNLLVTLESIVGLMGFAIATGIVFARFSRPTAEIIFSRQAVIAPYRGITAFMFRIVNARTNQLINVEAVVTLGRIDESGKRAFYKLELERQKVYFLPLHWVIVHPIDEKSPMYGLTQERLMASSAEFAILLTATDETFSQTVHARSSYKPSEVVWKAKFRDMFMPSEDGIPTIDLARLHDIEPVS